MKQKKGSRFLWMAAAVSAAVVFLFLFLRARPAGPAAGRDALVASKPARPAAGRDALRRVQAARPVAGRDALVASKPARPAETPVLSPAGRRLVADIERAYDADDLQKTLSLVEQARNSPEPEVRSSMVWSLGWFGKRAIRQLTDFLSDADAEVANDALGQWDSAIQEVTDEDEKVRLIEAAMERLTDKEALDDVALEYAGIDEKRAVESLLRVLSGKNRAAADQARETYETITGQPFTSAAAAYQRLLQQQQD